ncbi:MULTISPECIES: hypothetical protein [Bacillus subtilis group]|uniref:hypothetical protein n=1 Tax=Bacillus subtilis group TaxID=653685 RepID=UPI000554C3AA|nr:MULTISPECIES: hypothetical protein [Bacillus subtilis group]MDE1392058.1 hypothetical protein [Bacillus paralicheniformis]MEC1037679.1 hypothetical protein [Bacillus licheniformis]QAW38396.1 hypothetical protein ETK49_14370 [Bacillus licheniformis]QSV42574.1 hypothetical protein G6536_14365 [Bacillus licheniformis]
MKRVKLSGDSQLLIMQMVCTALIILWSMNMPQIFSGIETDLKGLYFLFSFEWASPERNDVVTIFSVVYFNLLKFISWANLFALLTSTIYFMNREFLKKTWRR